MRELTLYELHHVAGGADYFDPNCPICNPDKKDSADDIIVSANASLQIGPLTIGGGIKGSLGQYGDLLDRINNSDDSDSANFLNDFNNAVSGAPTR